MIGIGALSIVLPPAQVVPAFLAIEMPATINLLPGEWRQIYWRSLRWLVAGTVLATSMGMRLLAGLDSSPMRLFVSPCLLTIALLMRSAAGCRAASAVQAGFAEYPIS